MARPVNVDHDFHDIVVRYVAENRFPFPDQIDWPAEYVTITSDAARRRGIEDGGAVYFPDIIIVDSSTGSIVEIGEVEVEAGEELADKWRLFAGCCRQHPVSGARHFFVYVPAGLEGETQALLERHAIAYGGVRAYAVTADGQVEIVPIATPVDPKDHR